MKRLTTSLVALALTSTPAFAQDFDLEPISIEAVSPRTAELEDLLSYMDLEPGTAVTVLVSTDTTSIVDINREATALDRFADDLGTDLLDAPQTQSQGFFGQNGSTHIGPFPQVAPDGSLATVQLQAPAAPEQGAGAVQIEGALVLRVADDVQTHTRENVSLNNDEVEIDGHTIQIAQGDGGWGDTAMSVSLSMPTETDEQLAEVRFLDQAGQPLDVRQIGSMTMFDTAEREFSFDQEADTATLEFDVYQNIRDEQVPLDLTVTLGL